MSAAFPDHLVARNRRFLENLFRRGPFEGHAYICHPPLRPSYATPLGDYTVSRRPVSEWVPDLVVNYECQCRFVAALGDHQVPMANLVTGTHPYAAAFGCTVHRYPDANPAALPLVRTAAEADALPEPDIWSCPALYRVFELADAVRRELGSDVPFSPPDLQSGFDTASLVWNKEDFFCAMVTDPEAVKRLVRKCAGLFRNYLSALRREIPTCAAGHCPRAWVPPELPPWLSNDECGAFGTAMFEEFCLPELLELSVAFGGLGMHCCADAEHQYASFNRIPNLYAFNRVMGKRCRGGWAAFFRHFQGPQAPVHVLGWLVPATVKQIKAMVSPGTRLVFVHAGDDLEACRAWLDQVR